MLSDATDGFMLKIGIALLVLLPAIGAVADERPRAALPGRARVGLVSELSNDVQFVNATFFARKAHDRSFENEWVIGDLAKQRAIALLGEAGYEIQLLPTSALHSHGEFNWGQAKARPEQSAIVAGTRPLHDGIVSVPRPLNRQAASEFAAVLRDHHLQALVLLREMENKTAFQSGAKPGYGVIVATGIGERVASVFAQIGAFVVFGDPPRLADTARCADYAALPERTVSIDRVRDMDFDGIAKVRPALEFQVLDRIEQDLRASGLLGEDASATCRNYNENSVLVADLLSPK